MQELSCGKCGNRVLVAKYSAVQTSVQWLTDAESSCPEFGDRAASGEQCIGAESCSSLRSSIEKAVEAGELATDFERCEPAPGRLS